MKRQVLILPAVGIGAVIAGQRLARRYRLDLDAAQTRLAAVDRTAVMTRFGTVEYAERGSGEPLLSIHGFFGGCDAGLNSLRGLAPAGRRVIAPSRFGYLGSSTPPRATPADQADAFVALLDDIGIARLDVIAISSGATSAIQLALRHPSRLKHLVVISGNLPGAGAAITAPRAARLVYRDVPMWTLKALARPVLLRQIGVPRRFPLEDQDARLVSDFLESLFPVAPRAEGVTFDAFVSDPDVNNYRLEALVVPAMFVHAKDDPLVSYDVAQRAVGRVPGARLVSVERGGHLMLGGHGEFIAAAVAEFLAGQFLPGQSGN